MVNKYPNYKIVNFDKARRARAKPFRTSSESIRASSTAPQLDYCSSLKNLDSIRGRPNYSFVKVCAGVWTPPALCSAPT